MKVVINTCYGGFNISPKGIQRYLELKGKKAYFYVQAKHRNIHGKNVFERVDAENIKNIFWYTSLTDQGSQIDHYPQNSFSRYDIKRNDPILVQVVEELGKESFGDCARLSIVDIPKGTCYKITEYDGYESIEYKHDYDGWQFAE